MNIKEPTINHIKLPNTVAVLGKGMIKNNALLSPTLQSKIYRYHPIGILNKTQPKAFIGWGLKKSWQRARDKAQDQNLPIYSIEDGFLRSINTGIHSKHALSMVIDDLGIYFNLKQSSRLEQMILSRCHEDNWSALHKHYTNTIIEKIITHNLSKYNSTLDCPSLHIKSQTSKHVLLVDQVEGDHSILGSGLTKRQSKQIFYKMLKNALQSHPDATIWIKMHPANKKGYLSKIKKHKKRVRVIKEKVNPIMLLKQISHVYTVSSHMGFEALMLKNLGHNITVHCYGINWYSGWGLTEDYISKHVHKLHNTVKDRRASNLENSLKPTLEILFFAAYLDYSHYVDPATHKACNIDDSINWLITNQKWHQKLKGPVTIHDFSKWKIPFIKKFINFENTKVLVKPNTKKLNFIKGDMNQSLEQNPNMAHITWGFKNYCDLSYKLDNVYCMEDGFIRSNGLGATLLAPLSLVLDSQGIYYNATQVSDLETLLNTCPDLNKTQMERVTRLQRQLLNQRVSKYNVGKAIGSDSYLSKLIQNKKIKNRTKILIVGQVEDDLSIKYCGSLITTNTDLIKAVRMDNPNAFLIYKPHPDVEAGLRKGKVQKETLSLTNTIAHDVAMPDCLALVDEVHTISSLTGFEALLRGISVSCYGLPFYAGWGLTIDKNSSVAPKSEFLLRRNRKDPLTVLQLIYCTLIEYPMYILPDGHGLAQVEQVIDYLYNQPANHFHSSYSKKKRIIQSTKRNFMKVRRKILQLKED